MLTQTAGDVLRHARWKKGLTIRQAADASGVSTKTIVKLEKGNSPRSGETIYDLCRVYGIDPLPLFTDAPEPEAVGE